MPVTTRGGDETRAPSWKVLVMTALTVLVPIALNHLTDLSDGEVTAISGFLVFLGGYIAPPHGVA